MITKIYKNYTEFLNRENKEENGVSEEFAQKYPKCEVDNESNKGCWNCRKCSYCSYCSYCSECSDCSSCSECSDCSKNKGDLVIPKIDKIHQKVLEAVNHPEALDMKTWHTCETTHCRAGWVVTLAGKEGKELEKKTNTLFAAMTIYRDSSPINVHVPRFFDTNKKAMEDIKRCAELEVKNIEA